MSLSPSSKSGQLYLGGVFDLENSTLTEDAVYYDSRDLVTHGVCIGMTGSGKTGVCISLLEECALSGVPLLLIDPKGDLANLLLQFPELKPEDFAPWINPDEARRKNVTPADLAATTAEKWRAGLEQWGLGKAHIAKLTESAEFSIFTPGSTSGLPLNILQSFDAPPDAATMDDELLRDQISGAVSALLGLLGSSAPSPQTPQHILLSTILERRWKAGEKTDLASLITLIQQPPFDKLGALSLDAFFPPKERMKLALELNTLLASPSFQSWLQGEPLSVDTLLRAKDGRPRVSICYLAHLNDAERMFFISLLLNQVLTWMRRQPGTDSLRALLYFDEIFGYLPPHPKDPPSKRLLMTLLKQGRAFGLGTMVVTQNPVDLDYKALSNCGTWLIGKLQTDQDKDRILDGLQGASGEAGQSANRKQLDTILSKLGNRVFLLHNVHAEKPIVLQSRWAMSYLAGPLTRAQLRLLPGTGKQTALTAAAEGETGSLSDFIGGDSEGSFSSLPPPPPQGLTTLFSSGTELYPSLFATAEILYRPSTTASAVTKSLFLILSPDATPDWHSAQSLEEAPSTTNSADAGTKFAPLPAAFSDVNGLKKLGKDLIPFLLETQTLDLFENKPFGLRSTPGESREAFATRTAAASDAEFATKGEKLKAITEKKLHDLHEDLEKEKAELTRDQQVLSSYKQQATLRTLSKVGSMLASMLGGRRSSSSMIRGASSVASAYTTGGATRERAEHEVEESEVEITRLNAALEQMQTDLQTQLEQMDRELDAEAEKIETIHLAPAKTNIRVTNYGILWQSKSE